MNRMSWWRAVAITVLVIAAASAIGFGAYNAGVAQGIAESSRAITPPAGAAPYPYPFAYGHHHWGFGFFPFFPLLFFFLFFFVLRGLFWGGPWRRGWGCGYGYADGPRRADATNEANPGR
jgi:hypothetical protein